MKRLSEDKMTCLGALNIRQYRTEVDSLPTLGTVGNYPCR